MTTHADPSASVDKDLLTIDELALATGLTVRTTRYYASLGLLPAPLRRGRMAYYGPMHLGRLQLIRTLQEQGYTLAAIERHLATVPMDSTVEEIAVQRALISAWHTGPVQTLNRRELEELAGRSLSEPDLEDLTRIGAVTLNAEGSYEVLALTERAVETLDLGTPIDAIVEANVAVRNHMEALADELTRILHERVLPELQGRPDEADRVERTVANLRSLTLDAIVLAFQRAANQVALSSLTLDPPTGRDDPGQTSGSAESRGETLDSSS